MRNYSMPSDPQTLLARYLITPVDIADMREWLRDLTFRDAPDISELSDVEVIAGVVRHWDGGDIHPIADFLNAANRRAELLA